MPYGTKGFLHKPGWDPNVFEVPLKLAELPPIDYILLSHDHYDHLDKAAFLFLASKAIPIITMLGVGKRLINWGVPAYLVTEMDWWQQMELKDGFRVTALLACHFFRSFTKGPFYHAVGFVCFARTTAFGLFRGRLRLL